MIAVKEKAPGTTEDTPDDNCPATALESPPEVT
jgi:hypothetical protein